VETTLLRSLHTLLHTEMSGFQKMTLVSLLLEIRDDTTRHARECCMAGRFGPLQGMAPTGQADTRSVLQSTQCCQVSFLWVNDSAIYNYKFGAASKRINLCVLIYTMLKGIWFHCRLETTGCRYSEQQIVYNFHIVSIFDFSGGWWYSIRF
jgi:hypothetical protein